MASIWARCNTGKCAGKAVRETLWLSQHQDVSKRGHIEAMSVMRLCNHRDRRVWKTFYTRLPRPRCPALGDGTPDGTAWKSGCAKRPRLLGAGVRAVYDRAG